MTFVLALGVDIIATGGGNTSGTLGENDGETIFCAGLLLTLGDITNSGVGVIDIEALELIFLMSAMVMEVATAATSSTEGPYETFAETGEEIVLPLIPSVVITGDGVVEDGFFIIIIGF